MHKFVTNKHEVLEAIPESKRSFEEVNMLENIQNTLGVEWAVSEDVFIFGNTIKIDRK